MEVSRASISDSLVWLLRKAPGKDSRAGGSVWAGTRSFWISEDVRYLLVCCHCERIHRKPAEEFKSQSREALFDKTPYIKTNPTGQLKCGGFIKFYKTFL